MFRFLLLSCRWKQYAPPIRRHVATGVYGITGQKAGYEYSLRFFFEREIISED
jgi:hypothetical protein